MADDTKTYDTAHGPVTLSTHIDKDLAERLESDVCPHCEGRDSECRFCSGTGKTPKPPQEFTDWVKRHTK